MAEKKWKKLADTFAVLLERLSTNMRRNNRKIS